MQNSFALFPSPFGWCGIVKGNAGVQRIFLPETCRQDLEHHLMMLYPQAEQSPDRLGREIAQLRAYFSGRKPRFSFRLDFQQATRFQRTVWAQVCAIAYGTVQTYSGIARKIGALRAARAVGRAVGKNPFPIVIPCHRVIREDGRLGGFSTPRGIELKAELLRLEGAACSADKVAGAC